MFRDWPVNEAVSCAQSRPHECFKIIVVSKRKGEQLIHSVCTCGGDLLVTMSHSSQTASPVGPTLPLPTPAVLSDSPTTSVTRM